MTTQDENIQYGQYVVPESKDCVNFAVGQPSSKYLPLIQIQNAMIKITKRTNPALLQYGNITGYSAFTKDFAKYLSDKYNTVKISNTTVDQNELLPTNGITGALSLILSTCKENVNEKIVIFCENPTYFLALNIFKDFGYKVIAIDMENDGINLSDLKTQIYLNSSTKCFLYTIPIHQNPTGITMSHEKRLQLGKILDSCKNLTVIADEVYHNLSFNTDTHHIFVDNNNNIIYPMKYYHERCISMGSFSKTLAPSLRMGWIHANKNIIAKLVSSGQLDSSGCVNPLGCSIVHELIKNGELDDIENMWKEFLSNNCDVLYDSLLSIMGKYIKSITKPKGGYFLWVELINEIDTELLSQRMESYNVKFHHGNKFSYDKKAGNIIRLSFSWYTASVNESECPYVLGVTRLKDLIESNFIDVVPAKEVPIHILGSTGKLGSLIKDELESANNITGLYFAGSIDRNMNLDNVTKNSIIVDVSNPEGTKALFTELLKRKLYCKVLIGTTGELPMNLIDQFKKKYSKNVVISSNFSQGIEQIIKMLSTISKDNWDVSLIEKHHSQKLDKPSGTAKTLVDAYGRQHIVYSDIVSIRAGDIIGEHSLILTNGPETIEIKHIVNSRDVFAKGALRILKAMSVNEF